jgi:hypothetical protein
MEKNRTKQADPAARAVQQKVLAKRTARKKRPVAPIPAKKKPRVLISRKSKTHA